MIRRYALLPLAALALTALAACEKEDPFADKTYVGCMDADSLTFHADGTVTAVLDGQDLGDRFKMSFVKISDTEIEITAQGSEDKGYAEALDDGTLNFTVPSEGIDQICEPKE